MNCKTCDFKWHGGEKNILHFTTGKRNGFYMEENGFGFNFPTFNLDEDDKLKIYMPKEGDKDNHVKIPFDFKSGETWLHFTVANVQDESDSTNNEHKLSLRVNGKLAYSEKSTIKENYEVAVYGSSRGWESLERAYHIKDHTIHNFRVLTERKSK